MEPKCYQVKVLHYLNPHLIWVEVLPTTEDAAYRQNLFEQIGVYGVLPLDTMIDMLEDSIESCKTQEWCRGVVNVMDELLLNAKCVWFSPVYEDRRTSIFDSNIHKYGKLIVLDSKGDLVDLSQILMQTMFAYYDGDIFLHELTTFQLKTTINRYKTAGIIRALEKCYPDKCIEKLEALKAITSIVRAEQDFEDQLTNPTQQGTPKILPLTPENIRLALERKWRDFQQCKDINEVSIGRGTSSNGAFAPRSPGLKASDVAKSTSSTSNQDLTIHFRDMKKMLLAHAKCNNAQKQITSTVSPDKSDRTEKSKLNTDITPELSRVTSVQLCPSSENGDNPHISVKSHDSSFVSSERPYETVGCEEGCGKANKHLLNKASQSIKESEHCEQQHPTSNYNPALLEINETNTRTNEQYSPNLKKSYKETNSFEDYHEPVQVIKKKSTKKPTKMLIPKNDAKTQALVAYGPPDFDKTKLVLKVAPKLFNSQSFEDQDTRTSRVEDTAEIAVAEPRNSLEGLDSEIDYPTSNKAYLKAKFKANTSKKSNEAYDDESLGRLKSMGESKEVSTYLSESQTQVGESKEDPTFLNHSQPTESPLPLVKTGVVESEESKAESRPQLSHRDTLTYLLLRKKLAQTETKKQAHTAQPLSKNDSFNSTLCRSESNVTTSTPLAYVLKRKLELLRKFQKHDSSSTASDTSQKDMSSSSSEGVKTKTLVKSKHRQAKDSDSDESTLSSIVQKLNLNEKQTPTQEVEKSLKLATAISNQNHVNPFENHDASVSKFVDKCVSPVLMVHTKQGHRLQPVYDLNDVNFTLPIHRALKELSIKQPMTLQTVTWPSILRGYSLFIVSPAESGKTLGSIPAVCHLVADFNKENIPESAGPIAIIVCATAFSVLHVDRLSRRFLGHGKVVLSCYAGVDEKDLLLSLLNGCDVFVCTPPALVRLLNVTDFGVDLRRLTTFVLDDCERLCEVYLNEIKFVLIKIKEMLRKRADKLLKVQFIVASRIWCDFMEHLVPKVPNPMICIGSFQECILYSKSGMSVNLTPKESKTDAVMAFMRSIDASKRTVIVCRTDEEVDSTAQILKKHNHVVFAGKNSDTVEDLYNLNAHWSDYDVNLVGPVLVCCDSNLIKLNTTNAHNLLHYSLPSLFSMFSRRFSVLIDNFPSTFKEQNETVKIKILLDESNVEQLPKILHFIKRCTNEFPDSLDAICDKVLAEKDALKAQNLVPICDNTMALGECPDFWNCRARHTLFKECDEPKHWVPRTGHITFKILHYHTAIGYSARLIANIVNGQTKEYAQTYGTLPFKMGLFYTKESNKRPHGDPEIGDICAVAIRDNFFERCQVIKILNRYDQSGKPNYVLVKLIDEEKWERTRDVHLYQLPEELKKINTHVVQVILAGVQPKDRDITFSELAKQHLQKLTDKHDNIYMRAKVVMALSNTVLIDDLEACQDLTLVGETVVRSNFKNELLRTHAEPNPEHVKKLQERCERDGVKIKTENTESPAMKPLMKELPKPRWAHLDKDIRHLVYFAWADNPDKFFIRLEKFEECLVLLTNAIEKHVAEGNAVAISEANQDDIVLAKFPDDSKYYRARIDRVFGDNKVQCFFVDHGDWRHVDVKDLKEITANLITKLPFQAIECRLIGIKPVGNSWSEYSTNWLCDQCYVGQSDDLKEIYVKYFTKEIPECTGGHKYGIALIDTTTELVINISMIEYNLASVNEEETEFLNNLNVNRKEVAKSESGYEDWMTKVEKKPTVDTNKSLEILETKQPSLDQTFLKKPIRSVPLVSSDDDSDKWDVQFTPEDIKPLIKQVTSNCLPQDTKTGVSVTNVPAILPKITQETFEKDSSVCSSKLSDYEMIPSPRKNIETLDSDDYTSPELTQNSEVSEEENANEYGLRKPKVLWRQNEKHVSMKILLVGVEKYEMDIQPRAITFKTNLLDTEYGFHLDLYGVVHSKQSIHSSKGQYLYVKLTKLLKKQWIHLTQDSASKKWIVYDPDDINASSDDDEEIHAKKDTLKKIVVINDDSDAEDEDLDGLLDDFSFRHRYHRDSH